MHEKRFAASLAHRLDDPARLTWLPPTDVLAALDLHAGDTVADVGAGTGYFSLPLAQAVGPAGKVYAVDAQVEMLALLMQKAKQAGLGNIEPIHAEAEHSTLPSSSCNLYFLANVWHELDDHDASIKEARRVLKPGGKLAILDWRPDVEPEQGPPLAHRLAPSHAIKLLRATGFEAVLYVEIGLYSWLVQGESLP